MGLCLELGNNIVGRLSWGQSIFSPAHGPMGMDHFSIFSDKSQEKQGSPQLEQSEYCRLSHQHLGNDAFLLSTSSDQPDIPGKHKIWLKNWSHKKVTKHIFLIIPPCAVQCCKSFQPFSSHDFGTEEVEDNSSRQFPKSSRKEVERVVRQSQDLTQGPKMTEGMSPA